MSENHPKIFSFPSAQELAITLADELAVRLTEAITQRGTASLIVSGGSTPRSLFSQLAQTPIDWQEVIISLADERWVDPQEASSNEHLVRSVLLQKNAAAASFIGLKNVSPSARQGEYQCHSDLKKIPKPFDIVILGMGDDGHTASLFPGAERLSEAVDMQSGRKCISISPSNAPFDRMTLTLPTLLESRLIVLHITGKKKRKVLDDAFGEGPADHMPIRWILRQQKTPVYIYWAP